MSDGHLVLSASAKWSMNFLARNNCAWRYFQNFAMSRKAAAQSTKRTQIRRSWSLKASERESAFSGCLPCVFGSCNRVCWSTRFEPCLSITRASHASCWPSAQSEKPFLKQQQKQWRRYDIRRRQRSLVASCVIMAAWDIAWPGDWTPNWSTNNAMPANLSSPLSCSSVALLFYFGQHHCTSFVCCCE